jgi:hypothetical protein
VCAGFFPERPRPIGEATSALHNWLVYMSLGLFVLFWAGFSILLAFLDVGDWLGDLALWVCAPVTLAVGLGLMGYGLKLRSDILRETRRLQEIAGVLREYRRMKIADLARKLNVNEFEAERTIGQCIEKGYVEGFVDRSAGEFVAREALVQVAAITGCPRCGAPPERVMLIGETNRCGACGAAYPVNQVPAGGRGR